MSSRVTIGGKMYSVDDNPYTFWYEHRFAYLTLSQLTRSIYSIPATTDNVKRQFSSRPTRLNPEKINNAMFLRSGHFALLQGSKKHWGQSPPSPPLPTEISGDATISILTILKAKEKFVT
jgi:hypothetical protein